MRKRFTHLPQALAAAMLRSLRIFWWYLRQVSGDAAYENYRRRIEAAAERDRAGHLVPIRRCETAQADFRCSSERLPSREQFYLDTLRRRYSGVSRCC